MWRPDNWEDDKFHRCMDLTRGGGDYADIYEVFEAGADAMLKTLKKRGFYFTGTIPKIIPSKAVITELGISITVPIGGKGWLVFIEEEKRKDKNESRQ